MKTLKEIKKYLKEQETERLVSKRGNAYDVVKIDEKLLKKIKDFKSLGWSFQTVNNINIYELSWREENKYAHIFIRI